MLPSVPACFSSNRSRDTGALFSSQLLCAKIKISQTKQKSHSGRQHAVCVPLTSCDSHAIGAEQRQLRATHTHIRQCYGSRINLSATDGCTPLSSPHPISPEGPAVFSLALNFIFALPRSRPEASAQAGNLSVPKRSCLHATALKHLMSI